MVTRTTLKKCQVRGGSGGEGGVGAGSSGILGCDFHDRVCSNHLDTTRRGSATRLPGGHEKDKPKKVRNDTDAPAHWPPSTNPSTAITSDSACSFFFLFPFDGGPANIKPQRHGAWTGIRTASSEKRHVDTSLLSKWLVDVSPPSCRHTSTGV